MIPIEPPYNRDILILSACTIAPSTKLLTSSKILIIVGCANCTPFANSVSISCLSFSPILIASRKNGISVLNSLTPILSLNGALVSNAAGCNATGKLFLPLIQARVNPVCFETGKYFVPIIGSCMLTLTSVQ